MGTITVTRVILYRSFVPIMVEAFARIYVIFCNLKYVIFPIGDSFCFIYFTFSESDS